MTKHANLTDHFLIAMPQLEGSFFGKSLIYMCQHNEDGALGIVVNLPLEIRLYEVFEQLNINDERPASADQTILSGGPVEMDKGFILHDSPNQWESTISINEELNLTTSKDILTDIGTNKAPSNYLIALGCSGWSSGQLEQEIIDNSWLTCPANKEILFSTDYANKPNLAAGTLGFSMEQLTPETGSC